MRKEIFDKLIPYFDKDDRYYLIILDCGFGVIDNFKKAHPDRYINIGIMEQAAVNIAMGMAIEGKIPIIYSIMNFIVFRALDQVRNIGDLNVKLIGYGKDNYFDFLGKSHTCDNKDIPIMEAINMPTYEDFDAWIASPEKGYLRI